jgi:hypothetical protein
VRLRHDVGDAERSANFDQLSARDDDFAAVGKRVQREQDGGGVIVHDESGERRRILIDTCEDLPEKTVGVDVALAASSGREIEFEIGVGRCSVTNVIDGRSGQRSAAEIGVKDHAGGIDDWTERISESASEFVIDGSGKSGESEINFELGDRTTGNLLTEAFENGARGGGDGELAITADQGPEIRGVHEFVGGGELAEERIVGRGWHEAIMTRDGLRALGPWLRVLGSRLWVEPAGCPVDCRRECRRTLS